MRRRRVSQLLEAVDRLAALPALTEAEVEAEIQAARAEKRSSVRVVADSEKNTSIIQARPQTFAHVNAAGTIPASGYDLHEEPVWNYSGFCERERPRIRNHQILAGFCDRPACSSQAGSLFLRG